jgi:FlaA1/EpsC-like NDP-sugar epimerase
MEIEKYPDWLEYLKEEAAALFKTYSLPRWMLFIHDVILVFLTFIFAYLLRFNLVTDNLPINDALVHGFVALVIYILFSLIFKSYAGLIRHTTLTDITLVFVVTTSAAFCLIMISLIARLFGRSGFLNLPISVVLIHYVLITVILFFMRISTKMIFRFVTSSFKLPAKRVLIYGAGEMGFIVKRVILSDPRGGFSVSGFIDDNKYLQGKKINGIPVYSKHILCPEFIKKHKIETLILACRQLSPLKKSGIILKAINFGLEILETPAIEKWLNGQLDISQLESVKLEDLLGRDPIQLDMDLIREGLNDKVIMVTGAAGSIGSEIVRQLSRFSVKTIILVDQAETPMFHLENELRKVYSNLNFISQLGDVTNKGKMEMIFRRFHPEIVFHAAAYKHVPLMEGNPHEAFRVNIGGTKIVTELSVIHGVEKFVMISTDKSVNPTNIMGASKKACELLVQSMAIHGSVKTQFVITRFGNVLGSNGSVIPLFKDQIREGGPVTVTHPEITRYFMTIPEACQLVLEAGFMGKGGEIFVFNMGSPVKILDLAKNMIRLSGLEPGKDIKIKFTGLRSGEKLFEELLSEKENLLPTFHKMIRIAKVDRNNHTNVIPIIQETLANLYDLSEEKVMKILEDLVPEYKLSKEINGFHFPETKQNKIETVTVQIPEQD